MTGEIIHKSITVVPECNWHVSRLYLTVLISFVPNGAAVRDLIRDFFWLNGFRINWGFVGEIKVIIRVDQNSLLAYVFVKPPHNVDVTPDWLSR